MKPRDTIKHLKSYEVIDDDYILKLDANESVDYLKGEFVELTGLELYPDNDSKALRKALARDLKIDEANLTMGNGSSELLDLLFKAYVSSGDVVLSFDPSFSMYEIYAKIYEASFIKVSGDEDFSLDMNRMIEKLLLNPKMIILCTPNNPTGYQIPKKDILTMIEKTDALVIVDEAYMEFSSDDQSVMNEIKRFDNLVVLRTFSKAYGLAGARLGYMISGNPVTSIIKKIRSPYHVNAVSQKLGILALSKKDQIFQSIESIKEVRSWFASELINLGFKVYPSQGNFLWVYSPILDLGEKLKTKGVLIRSFASYKNGYYRITIRTQEDMRLCLTHIKEIIHENI